MMRSALHAIAAVTAAVAVAAPAMGGGPPARARRGMVSAQHFLASQVGVEVLWEGGNAVDAAVATAFALAVVHPTAGNLGGGGFLLYRPMKGEPAAYDFREVAPRGSHPRMWLGPDGSYDPARHHEGHLSVGVPGTVAGLHLAWREHGTLPWKRLVDPAVVLASEGFVVTDTLARSLRRVLPSMKRYPASVAQFSREGTPYEPGDILKQPELARTLERIARDGSGGFYEGETARLLEEEMRRGGGLLTREDLRAYRAKRRAPLKGTYRGHEVLAMPPVSSGGVALLTMLNILEGYDLAKDGHLSAANVHRITEAMRRAFADRARYMGDPDFNPDLPLARLVSKEHAAGLRRTIHPERASRSTPERFEWPAESPQTTHFSVIDEAHNAVALTYTLEDGYGSKIVVPGAGFLLNNEMGDFNAGPGLTDARGLIGTEPNLAQPGKRMLSSMTPTIVVRDGEPVLVVGALGGRTIINTVLLAVLNFVDFGMNMQEAIDAPRFHHQWLPDEIRYEKHGLSPDTVSLLRARGHALRPWGEEMAEGPGQRSAQGVAHAAGVNRALGVLEGAADRRDRDAAAVGR